MADGGTDTARDAALEPTLASDEVKRTDVERSAERSDPLGDTIAAGDATAAAVELPEAAPDRYTLGDEIGRGGLGTVVRASDRNLGRQVAIKALHAEGGSARRRFVREALITARLEHPSIVPVHDAGRWRDGSPFYAMKLVRGRPLAAVIDERRDLAARLGLVPTVLAVCDAVAYAHSERVVHRDLKPHNVLVGEFGETVVIDWGLAKDLGGASSDEADPGAVTKSTDATRSTETVVGAVLGTPAYMAPEQALGAVVDERADVYALGAMLYHVLVGKPPHDGGSVDEVLDHAVTGAVIPLERREPGVPRDLAAIVGKAMARKPDARYPSAREAAEDLRRFTTGQLVGARRYTWSQRAWRWLARRRAIALTVAGAVAAIAIIGTISVRDVLHERDRADEQRDVAVAASTRADEQRAAAQAAGNQAVLAQARGALARDPAEALAWLATLSVDGPGWAAARAIAADALWRDPPALVLRGHRGTPRGLSVGSAARAVTWDDGAVWLWDLGAGTGRAFTVARTQAAFLCGDDGRILGQGVRPDGALSDYTIDPATGAIAYGAISEAERARCGATPSPAPDDCFLVAATPDGGTIACGDPVVSVRAPGKPPRVLRKRPARLLDIDDDGKWIAADDAGDGNGATSIDVFDAKTGAKTWSIPVHGQVHQLAFGPDGDHLLVVGDDGLLWDVAHGGARPFGDAGVIAAAFLPDGRIATVGADRALRIWAPRPLPPRLDGEPTAAALTPDGKAAVTGAADGALARLELASEPAKIVERAKLSSGARALAVRADGATLVTTAGGDIYVWRSGAAPEKLGTHKEADRSGAPDDLAWLGDDALSWNGATVRVWPGGRAPMREIELPPLPPPPKLTSTPGDIVVMPGCATPVGAATGLVAPPRGRTIAIARADYSTCGQLVYLIDVDRGTAALLDGAEGHRPAFTPDGASLVTSGADGAIRVWDVATHGARRMDAHLLHPHAAAVSADGAWLAMSGEGAVALAHVNDAQARTLEVDEPDLLGAWFSDDGATLVVASETGAWLWDLASGERRHVGVGVPLAVRAGAGEVDVVAAARIWRLRDDLPRGPAELAKRLGALGYAIPAGP